MCPSNRLFPQDNGPQKKPSRNGLKLFGAKGHIPGITHLNLAEWAFRWAHPRGLVDSLPHRYRHSLRRVAGWPTRLSRFKGGTILANYFHWWVEHSSEMWAVQDTFFQNFLLTSSLVVPYITDLKCQLLTQVSWNGHKRVMESLPASWFSKSDNLMAYFWALRQLGIV